MGKKSDKSESSAQRQQITNFPKAKTYVLDTNVLLHDPTSIFNFADNDVVISSIVIKELDKKKKGDDSVSIAAREVSRRIRELIPNHAEIVAGNEIIIPLGKGMGNLKIVSWNDELADIQNAQDFGDDNDGKIISVAFQQKERYSRGNFESVIFVTKDNNAAILATGKIKVEDYFHDQVKNVNLLSSNVKVVDDQDLDFDIHASTEDSEYKINQPIITTSKRIFRNDGSRWNECKVCKIGDTGLKPKSVEQRFAVDVLLNPSIKCVALIGAAGSGKTLLAVACGLAQRDRYDVKIARAAVELSGNSIGFLPGDLSEKYDPYFAPIRDACRVIMNSSMAKSETAEISKSKAKKKTKSETKNDEDIIRNKSELEVKSWMDSHGIEALHMNVIRGRTFDKSYLIIDEAQNLTPSEVKTIVTRAGKDTKVIFTGDVHQIDSRWLTVMTNGLSHLIDRFDGQSFFASIHLPTSERSQLAEAADKLL